MVDSTKDCEYVTTNTAMLQMHKGASHNGERLRNQWRMRRRTRGKMMKWFSRRYLLPMIPFQSLVPHQLLVPHLHNPLNLLNQHKVTNLLSLLHLPNLPLLPLRTSFKPHLTIIMITLILFNSDEA